MLSFEIAWSADPAAVTAAELTRGALTARIGNYPVWGDTEGGFEWTWIELLEFLAGAWRYIAWEEGDPLGLGDPLPDLRSAARARWELLPGAHRQSEEEELWAFESTHNLASAVQGAWLPDLWLLRRGNDCVISSHAKTAQEPISDALATLVEVASEIAGKLQGATDPRAVNAREAWLRRDEVSAEEFVSIATARDTEALAAIAGGQDVAAFFEIEQLGESTELLAAARMIGTALTEADTRALLNRIRKVKCRQTQTIDDLATLAREACEGTAPYEQGYSVAQWLRNHLGLVSKKIDPETLLASWNVVVKELTLSGSVDAVSCWGPQHGPAVFVNLRGQHAQHPWGRRATLAHEICHLLLDRRSALPLAEVLGGRVPREIEARARAFAAELLLPRDIAGTLLSAKVDDPKYLVRQVRSRFGVSQEIVCWQARNSGIKLPAKTAMYLRTVVQDVVGASWSA